MTLSTFSRDTKEELCRLEITDAEQRRWALIFAWMNTGVFRGKHLSLQTNLPELAELLQRCSFGLWGWRASEETRGSAIRLELLPEQVGDLSELLREQGRFTSLRGLTELDPSTLDAQTRRLALRIFFLTFGSVTDPHKAYHLELGFRRRSVAQLAQALLAAEGMETKLLTRAGSLRIYLKDGQQIADYLALTGAHASLLQFENLRVEKEMRNAVNRVVNCDSANSRRVAASSAKQLQWMTQLRELPLWESLQPELQAVVQLRLESPELSLRELGEQLEPPLGKSGVMHRLSRLEALAREQGLTAEVRPAAKPVRRRKRTRT